MPYEITERGMAEMHRRLNRRLFGCGLGEARFAVGRSGRKLGQFSQPPPTDERLHWPPKPLITLSARLCQTRGDAERTMAHEMAHQWVWQTYGPRRRGEPHHGPWFARKAAEINAAMGEGYVSVRIAAKFADDGKSRPVALLEFEDGTTRGCSAERRFTSRALRHIRYAARMAGAARVLRFRTRCPNAAKLPNANRTRVRLIRGGSRIRTWPRLPDGLRDELLRAAVGKVACVQTGDGTRAGEDLLRGTTAAAARPEEGAAPAGQNAKRRGDGS